MTRPPQRTAAERTADVVTTVAAFLSTGLAIAVTLIGRRWWRQ